MLSLLRKLLKLFGYYDSREIKDNIRKAIEYGAFHKKQVAEIHKLELDKWVEGEKIKKDPGEEFVERWVGEDGKAFHERFVISRCRLCVNVYKCPHVTSPDCVSYSPELTSSSVYVIKEVLLLLIAEKVLKRDDEIIKSVCSYYDISLDSNDDADLYSERRGDTKGVS